MARVTHVFTSYNGFKKRYEIVLRRSDRHETATYITDEMYKNPAVFLPFLKRLLEYARSDHPEDAPPEFEGETPGGRESEKGASVGDRSA